MREQISISSPEGELPGPLCVMPHLLAQTLTESLETMAFISPLPPVEGQPRAAISRISVSFAGQWSGTLELIACRELGTIMAANQIGCELTDPEASERAEDALMELANVACGLLLRKIAGKSAKQLNLLPPKFEMLDIAWWPSLLVRPGTVALDVENNPMLIHLVSDDLHREAME